MQKLSERRLETRRDATRKPSLVLDRAQRPLERKNFEEAEAVVALRGATATPKRELEDLIRFF
jgi:hypothetical protein